MAMTTTQKLEAGRELALRMFRNATANMNLSDLEAAIGSIDGTMDALPGTLNALQSVKVNFAQRLPEPFKSTSTTQQKAFALALWAMKEAGIS